MFELANEAWERGDEKQAFHLFLAAAKSGEVDAFNSVGFFYDHGIGVKKDAELAFAWYRRAAMRGCLAGWNNLAACYRAAGNFRRAKFWLEKARATGDGSAAYELGKIYLAQRSSISSRRKALRYLEEAVASKFIAEGEREEARQLLFKMEKQGNCTG